MIGGTRNFFTKSIIDKLKKERCSLYHISGKRSTKSSRPYAGITTYDMDLDDQYLQVVMKSISPDAVLFLGNYDDRYFWQDYHRCSAGYLRDLTNVLVSASDLNIRKFIYLSTINVYGFDNSGDIDESAPIAPSNVKSIIIAQGEKLCKDFSDRGNIDTIILRFGMIYGDFRFQSVQSDYIMNKCLEILATGKVVINNLVMPVIAATDAAIAVYKTIYLSGESDIYNVCDGETISDPEITDIILTEYSDLDIELEADDRFKPQDYNVKGDKFKQKYLFFQKTGHVEGIQAVARHARDKQHLYRRKQKNREIKDDEKNVWQYLKNIARRVLPYIENLLLFAVFSFLSYYFRDNVYLAGIDFVLLYVILVSVTFGKKHAVLFLILSIIFYGYQNVSSGTSILDLLISYQFVVRLMVLFIVGMLIGSARDRLYERIEDLKDRVEYVESEYKTLNEIHDVTVSIKNVFEERILSNDDSLAKNYSIIERITSLIPQSTYVKSLGVIKDIMKSDNICIYTRSNQKDTFKLDYWSSEEALKLGNVIHKQDFGELSMAIEQNGLYVNKALDKDIPILVSAIKVDGEIEALLMVWDIVFEALTMHHVNLFTTLTKIITHSIMNAVYYRRSLEKQFIMRYNPDRNMAVQYFLNMNEFVEAVEASKQAKNKYGIPYNVVKIKLANISVLEALKNIQPLLQRNHYMYKNGEDLHVLLTSVESEVVDDCLKNMFGPVNQKYEKKKFVVSKANERKG